MSQVCEAVGDVPAASLHGAPVANIRKEWSLIRAQQHARLDRIAIRRGASEVKRLFDRAHDEMMHKLRAHTKHLGIDAYSTHQARMTLALLKTGEAQLAAHMAGETKAVAKEARAEALHSLVANIERLEPEFRGAASRLSIEEAARFWGHESILRSKHVEAGEKRERLLRAGKPVPERIEEAFSRYSIETIGDMEKQLALSVIQQETPLQAMDRISDAVDGEWYRAERIVRTEGSRAFNEGHREGVEEAADDVDGLMELWSEFCDDDGEALDDRVAVDSLALHGQCVLPGHMFTCPPKATHPDAKGNTEVPKSLALEEFDCPPSRPNGRETVVPFCARWGVPGWRWSGGRRAWIVRPD